MYVPTMFNQINDSDSEGKNPVQNWYWDSNIPNR